MMACVRHEPMRLELRLVGTGWLRADLYVDGGHGVLAASYLTHALGDLLLACSLIGEGIDRVECRWSAEPGWSQWSIERVADARVHLRVVRSSQDDDDGVDTGQDAAADADMVVDSEQDLRRFLTEVLDAVDALHAEVGDDGYALRWPEHPYPHAAVERLREAIHGLGAGPVPLSQLVRAGAHRWFGAEELTPSDLAVELIVDVMYELADARDAVATVEVADRTITVTDDGPGWRVQRVRGEDPLAALLGAIHLPELAERGELAHVAALCRRFDVETVSGGARRSILLDRGQVVRGPSGVPAPGAPSMTRISCEPDWAWFRSDAGWPLPLPDLVGAAADRCRARAWWHPSIPGRIVVTDQRATAATSAEG